MDAALPTVSLVIATYNRGHCLPGLFTCLKNQTYNNLIEIIVVDNNSPDDTAKIVKDHQTSSKLPIHYFLETKQGVSNTRNRGVKEARGDIIAFTDDDGLPQSDWLEKTVALYLKDPSIHCVGGKVLLEWGDLKRPRWLNHYFIHSLSYFERPYSEPTSVTASEDLMIGCNLTVKRDAFNQVGGFDPYLGRYKRSLQEGEEPDFQKKIIAQGGKVVYHPESIVRHRIFDYQTRKSFFYRFYFGKAISMVRFYQAEKGQKGFWTWLKTWGHFSVRVPIWFLRTLIHPFDPSQRFYCWLQTCMNVRASLYCLTGEKHR